MPATLNTDIRRLTRPELIKLDTPEAKAELERRKAKRSARGKAYHEKADAEVNELLDSVVSLLEAGDLPAAIGKTYIRRQESDAPANGWSVLNNLALMIAGTHDARGRKQWEKVGRTVVAGANPIFILGPKMVTFTETDEVTGEETKRRAMRGFVGIPVYAVEDTEGDELEVADYEPATFPPLFEAAERMGVRVEWASHEGAGYFGFYRPGVDDITLVTHSEATFLHELAHAAHDRVLRAKGKSLKGGQHADQEIVAELAAATLCSLYGLDGYLADARNYIAHYAGGNIRRAIAGVLSDVSACLELILEAGRLAGEEVS